MHIRYFPEYIIRTRTVPRASSQYPGLGLILALRQQAVLRPKLYPGTDVPPPFLHERKRQQAMLRPRPDISTPFLHERKRQHAMLRPRPFPGTDVPPLFLHERKRQHAVGKA